MPKTGGPNQRRRGLLADVVNSNYLYAATIGLALFLKIPSQFIGEFLYDVI